MLISTTTLRRRSFALAWRDRVGARQGGGPNEAPKKRAGGQRKAGKAKVGSGRNGPMGRNLSLARARAPRDRGRRSVHDLGTAGAVIRCLRRARRAEAVGAAAVASVLPANSTALRAAMCQAAGFGLPVLP